MGALENELKASNVTPERAKKERKFLLLREKGIRDARKNFYAYCKLINPKFYKPNRTYLKEICDTFQALYEGKLINPKTGEPYRKMTLSVPPGHGKSYTASLFSMWLYGQDESNQIITVSYNEKMSGRFGATVRDGVEAEKGDAREAVFSEVFPNIKVKYGDASKHQWSLDGQYMSYLATSFKASLTGMRGNIGIIDDPIKSAYEAFNDNVLQDRWDWYTDTFLSRMLENAIQIVIATRWATKDVIGRLIEAEPDEWYVLEMPALQDKETETMLCPEILSYKTYSARKKVTSPEIFAANYDQQPVDMKGRLYKSFSTYTEIPKDEKGKPLFERIINYTDTADTGEDYLASIVAGVYDGFAYVLDVLYTKAPMEETEPAVAEMLHRNKVKLAKIESNNGGRGFARNVERELLTTHVTRSVNVTWFHQGKNKRARIMTNSNNVQRLVFFPVNWKDRWPEYHEAMSTYKSEGKNEHDDAPDATTGLVEMLERDTRTKAKAVTAIM